MDDYAREMMELKTLVTRTLEKKGVLAKIRAELRASVFEAIEEEDRAPENEDNIPPALLGSCNERAKQLHTTPSGRLLTALVSEYLEWGQLGHTLKVYLPECNLPKDFWKDELRNFNTRTNKNGESCPLLLDVLEGYLKYENLTQNRLAGGRLLDPDNDSSSNLEVRNVRRSSSSAASGGLPALSSLCNTGPVARNQSSDRKSNSSIPMSRKVDYAWKYNVDEVSEDAIRAANALENIQLDRKARNMTTTWRQTSDDKMDDSKVDRR